MNEKKALNEAELEGVSGGTDRILGLDAYHDGKLICTCGGTVDKGNLVTGALCSQCGAKWIKRIGGSGFVCIG